MNFEKVSLFDVLAAPTKERHEHAQTNDIPDETGLYFEEINDPIDDPEPEPEVVEEPYDAEKEAEKFIAMLNVGNTLALTPIAFWKMQKNKGGKKGLARLEKAYNKKLAGSELTENEKSLVAEFEQYKTDRALLAGEIPFTPDQLKTLKTLAIPYMESTKMKINSSFGFWSVFLGFEAQKITKILTA